MITRHMRVLNTTMAQWKSACIFRPRTATSGYTQYASANHDRLQSHMRNAQASLSNDREVIQCRLQKRRIGRAQETNGGVAAGGEHNNRSLHFVTHSSGRTTFRFPCFAKFSKSTPITSALHRHNDESSGSVQMKPNKNPGGQARAQQQPPPPVEPHHHQPPAQRTSL